MSKIQQNNIQRQIASLITIVEHCKRSSEDVDDIQNKIKLLPDLLKKLKEQEQALDWYELNNIDAIASYKFTLDKQDISSIAEPLELELDFLVNDLDEIMQEFIILKYKIDNIVVLREKIEAIQEERFGNISLDRICTLLEKHKKDKNLNINIRKNSRWQKVKKRIFEFKKLPKIAGATAIVISVISGFSLISYSSIKYQEIKQNDLEEVKNINKVSVNI